MKTSSWLWACAASLGLASASLHAEFILWVSDNGLKGTEVGSDGVVRGAFYPASATDGTPYVDQGFVDLLLAQGHTVTRFNPNPQAMSLDDVPLINEHDLIILGTALNSGPFNLNSRGPKWNTMITKPMIITKSTLIRRDRMGYLLDNKEYDCGADASVTASGKLTLVNGTHPIFEGIARTAVGGNLVMDQPGFRLVPSPLNNRGVSVQYFQLSINGVDQGIVNPVEPGGRVLATIDFNPMDPGVNIPAGQAPAVDPTYVAKGYAIVEWPLGTPVRTTQVQGETNASYRLLFACGTRDASGSAAGSPNPQVGAMDLTADGQKLFLNAVNHAIKQGPPRLISGPWGEWDYKQYLYGGRGNLVLSNQTATGFTAHVSTNDVDVVNNTTFEKGADAAIEPAGRPTIYREFPSLDLSRIGQKVSASFQLKFNNALQPSDQFVRFGFGNTNNNSSFYLKIDSGEGGGTTLGWRSDATTTDTNGLTLRAATFNPAGNLAEATVLNYPTVGPNLGFVSGNYSHFLNSGSLNAPGSQYPGGISSYPNGAGLGVQEKLDVVHTITMTMERVEGGLKIGATWGNSAGEEVLESGYSVPYIDAPAPNGHGTLDQIGCLGFNLMNNDLFALGEAGGSYTVSAFRLSYVSPPEFKVTSIVYASDRNALVLTWNSESGATYVVEATQKFDGWVPVASAVASQGETTVTEIATPAPGSFYRIRKE
jgi:hypothetical protein